MEMRACGGTGMSRDLTPPIPPLAVSLHDSFLPSHCSSCFLPLPPSPSPSPSPSQGHGPVAPHPSCCCWCGALRYCSAECRDADVDGHASSGECHLVRLVHIHHSLLPAWQRDDTADLRAALRLLRSFETLGFLLPPRNGSGRIGGLLAGNPGELEEGCELFERIREGRVLMSRARRLLRGEAMEGEDAEDGRGGGDSRGEAEEAVLWAVLTNAVEVQVGDGRALGIAVYGPQFSWFNHSCSPNACYRFELLGSEFFRSAEAGFLVYPTGTGPGDDMMATWVLHERKRTQGLCRYGPRIVVRSIRPIKQGEEVCITYTDLLQPKELRHSDLWSKYRFICCCKRCSAYPEMYVDHILCDTTFLNNEDLNSDRRHLRDMEIEEPADILDQAVTEYLSTGDTEACRSYIENMLTKGFRNEWLQLAESSQTRCKLQPLHFVSLKAFIMLASIYRTQACELETSNHSEEGIPEVFDLNRAMAAYSLLLAGATHHLFLFEPSLIVTTALFWINAGESFLVLVRSLICSPEIKWVNLSEFNIIFCNGRSIITCIDGSSLPCNEFQSTSLRFLDCVLRISSKVWLFMVSGIQCLTDVKSPIDFSCLGKKNVSHQILVREGVAAGPCHFGNEECVCIGCKCEAEVHAEEGIKNLYQLAIHCLVYGGYLSTICYGCQSYWINHVRKLLCGEAWS